MISGATASGSTAPASRAASATKAPQTPGTAKTQTAPGRKVQLNTIPKDAFGKTPDEAAKDADVIIRALQKEGMPVEVQIWAAKQLGVFDKELAVEPLLKALDSDHPEVVVAAIGALGQISAPETIPKILTLESHADPRVRAAVEEIVVEVR
jgi:HEAT repeat protein